MNIPKYLIVHHTGGTDANPLADTSEHTFQIVDDYHRSLGWGGIGYHYFIAKNGTLTQGRLDKVEGAHTIGYNLKSLGICLAGNFDLTLPTKAQEATLVKLLNDKIKEYAIPVENIVPHRFASPKTCYGKLLADDWARSLIQSKSIKTLLLAAIDALRKIAEQLP